MAPKPCERKAVHSSALWKELSDLPKRLENLPGKRSLRSSSQRNSKVSSPYEADEGQQSQRETSKISGSFFRCRLTGIHTARGQAASAEGPATGQTTRTYPSTLARTQGPRLLEDCLLGTLCKVLLRTYLVLCYS